MTVETLKLVEKILKTAGIEEYKQEAKMLVCEISGLNYEQIILGEDISNKDKIIELAHKRANTKLPIQYLIGSCYFMGDKYKLNDNVLIPRDETEILVKAAYELIKNRNKINILDIGTGSGCISCSLAKLLKNREIEVLGVDISLDALEVALENINSFDLVRKVILRKSDLFSKIRDYEKFDLIISNPPYIPVLEKNNLQKELSFEPEIALFASDKYGIEFYKKIIEKAPLYLKKDGYLAFELGINQAEKVYKMLKKDFKNIKIIKDFARIERVIYGKIKEI